MPNPSSGPLWGFWSWHSPSKGRLKNSGWKQSGESLSSPCPARRLLSAEEPFGLIVTLSHRPSSEFRGPGAERGRELEPEWGAVGLVSAEGEAPGAAAGVGVRGLLRCRRAPACCTSWSARSAQPLPAPRGLSPCAPTLASLGWCAGVHTPKNRFFTSAKCPCPRPSTLEPVHFASASVAVRTPSPFPGCAALGPQGEGARRSAAEHLRAAAQTPAQLLAGLGDPQSHWLSHRRTADPGRQKEVRPVPGPGGTSPGQGCRGVQGGTALNALDSPAPALWPPSSTDSWGLCFLHPPGGSRSTPTATRDSPSATAASRLVHPGRAGPAPLPLSGGAGWRPQARRGPGRSKATHWRVSGKAACRLEP